MGSGGWFIAIRANTMDSGIKESSQVKECSSIPIRISSQAIGSMATNMEMEPMSSMRLE